MAEVAHAIDQYHEAGNAFARGDPEPLKRLYSHREDTTLANPLGPPARGWQQVEGVMDRAAALIRDGEPLRYDRVSEYATRDLAYILEIERGRAKFGDSDTPSAYALRVTTIFRREGDEWKVVHRHADAITTARPVDSILAQ